MKSQSFGLDIGKSIIKAVALKKEESKFYLDAIVVAPIASKGIMSESPSDQKILADTIVQMLASSGIEQTKVNISIPDSHVYSKIIDMPQLSEQELTSALRWEIEQYVPLPAGEIKTDWQVLEMEEKPDGRKMRVLIVASPIRILEKYEKILSLANLTIGSIETETLSIYRALYPVLSIPAPSVVVHIGESTTNLAIIKNGILQMVFYLSLGDTAITRAVSIDLGIDMTQAEGYKKAYGLSQEVFQGKVGKSLAPVLESIVGDIKKTMLLYREKNDNEQIQQIVLSGGTALLPGIDIFFAHYLNVQVVIGSSWGMYGIGNIPEQLLTDASLYNVVTGLALRDIL